MGVTQSKCGSYNSEKREVIDEQKYGTKLANNNNDISSRPRHNRRRMSFKQMAFRMKLKKAKKQKRRSSEAVLREEFDKINRIIYDPESNKAKNMAPPFLLLGACDIQRNNEDKKENALEHVEINAKRHSFICSETPHIDGIVYKPFYHSMPEGFRGSIEPLKDNVAEGR